MRCVYTQCRYPEREAGNVSHNVVVYKASDVVYDLEHSACSSTQSQRLRMIQVHNIYIQTEKRTFIKLYAHASQESSRVSNMYKDFLRRKRSASTYTL